MFKKILVPLDGSEHSLRALRIAVEIAKNFKAQVTLIHVYSVISPVIMPQSDVQTTSTVTAIGPVLSPAELTEITQAGQKAGERVLMDEKEKISSQAVRINTLLQKGDVVQEITRVAKEGHFDLIVMGIRGLGKLKELIVGSVRDGVIRQASCPVSNCEVRLLSFGLA